MKAEDIQSADDLEAWLNGLPDDAERVKLVTQIVYRQAWTNLARLSHQLDYVKGARPTLMPFSIMLFATVALYQSAKIVNHKSLELATTQVLSSLDRISNADELNVYLALYCILKSASADTQYALSDTDFAVSKALIAGRNINPAAHSEKELFLSSYTDHRNIPEEIRADLRRFESGDILLSRPLWAFDNTHLWPDKALPSELLSRFPAWSVFKDLYENALNARPQNWPLLTALAQKDEAFWTGTDTEVLDRIAEVMEGFALSATYNGERIEVNPPTQKLMLVGEGALPDDLGHYARRKMRRAIDLFAKKLSNQYNPLTDAVITVRTAIEDGENIPMELFDACGSATRMVATLARSESIPRPEDDPLIGEFVQILREVAAYIIANDPKSQETLARRNAIEGNNALQVNARVINITVGQIVNVSEGALARELTLNAKDALEKNPESEDARDGAYKLSGRIIRALRVLRESAATFKEFKELYPAAIEILNNPQVQQAVQAILKYLSIG